MFSFFRTEDLPKIFYKKGKECLNISFDVYKKIEMKCMCAVVQTTKYILNALDDDSTVEWYLSGIQHCWRTDHKRVKKIKM